MHSGTSTLLVDWVFGSKAVIGLSLGVEQSVTSVETGDPVSRARTHVKDRKDSEGSR